MKKKRVNKKIISKDDKKIILKKIKETIELDKKINVTKQKINIIEKKINKNKRKLSWVNGFLTGILLFYLLYIILSFIT